MVNAHVSTRYRVHTDTLVNERAHTASDEELSRLGASMMKDGQEVAVLIHPDGRVIDGARRLAAVLRLGVNTIEVETATSLEIAVGNLTEAHQSGRIPTNRRIFDLFTSLDPLIRQRTTALRSRINTARATGEEVPRQTPSKELLGMALNIPHRYYFETVLRAYNTAIANGRVDIIHRLDSGEMAANTALGQLKLGNRVGAGTGLPRGKGPKGNVLVEAARRLEAITNVLATLDATDAADEKTRQDVEEQLARSRRTITHLINKLRKGVSE